MSVRPQRAGQSIAELNRVITAITARNPEVEQPGRARLQGVIAALIGEDAVSSRHTPTGAA